MSISAASPPSPGTPWWRRLLAGVRRRLRAKRLRVMYVYRHDLGNIPVFPLDPDCRIEVLDPAQVERLREVYPVNMTEKHRRLAAGHTCYVAVVGGKFAHYNWVQADGFHPIQDSGRRRRVRPGELWIYSGRTAEWARGRRLQTAVLAAILADARRQG